MNIVIIIISAIVAIYIALPFFLKGSQQVDEDELPPKANSEESNFEKLKTLNNRKDTLYSAITEIEFDYGLGKLSIDDFQELKSKYKLEAAGVLKQIDQINSKIELQEPDTDLEQEILSYRQSSPSLTNQDFEIEKEISAFRSANQSNNNTNNCKQCGAKYSSEDLFCSKCGAKLT